MGTALSPVNTSLMSSIHNSFSYSACVEADRYIHDSYCPSCLACPHNKQGVYVSLTAETCKETLSFHNFTTPSVLQGQSFM